MNLGTKLKQARKIAGISQKQLGSKLDLSDKAISAYEAGRAEPSLDKLSEMSRILNKPITYFFEEEMVDEIEQAANQINQLQTQVESMQREIRRMRGDMIDEMQHLRRALNR